MSTMTEKRFSGSDLQARAARAAEKAKAQTTDRVSPGAPDGVRHSARTDTAVAGLAAATRVSIGFVFLWAFFDKVFGLGHATVSASAWINGGSPSSGFLKGVQGPFAGVFNAMSGAMWADWLFMAGLLGIGVALTFGIGMRIAAVSGGILLVCMWAASLPIKTNPFMDDHLVYALVIGVLALTGLGGRFGLGRRWAATPIVRRWPALR